MNGVNYYNKTNQLYVCQSTQIQIKMKLQGFIKIIVLFLLFSSCNTSEVIPLNEDKAIQYGTDAFYEWESTKEIKIDEAYEIFKTHLSENPDIDIHESFKVGVLGFIYDDHYVFSTVHNNLKMGKFNLTGFWVNANTGEIRFKQTKSSITYTKWNSLYIGNHDYGN